MPNPTTFLLVLMVLALAIPQVLTLPNKEDPDIARLRWSLFCVIFILALIIGIIDWYK